MKSHEHHHLYQVHLHIHVFDYIDLEISINGGIRYLWKYVIQWWFHWHKYPMSISLNSHHTVDGCEILHELVDGLFHSNPIEIRMRHSCQELAVQDFATITVSPWLSSAASWGQRCLAAGLAGAPARWGAGAATECGESQQRHPCDIRRLGKT